MLQENKILLSLHLLTDQKVQAIRIHSDMDHSDKDR